MPQCHVEMGHSTWLRVTLWGTGCVHCKHCQGQTLLHFAQAFSLGGPRTFALIQAEILASLCSSGAA